MRPELLLPLYNKLLDRHTGKGELDYERAIRTPELLALQDGPVAQVSHDGTTFVLTHQCQELKLKLVAHELSKALDLLDQRLIPPTLAAFDRVRIVFQCLSCELEILETLSPRSYQTIRQTLGRGSGQESPGYNQVLAAAPFLWDRLLRILAERKASLEQVYDFPEMHAELFVLCESFTTLDSSFQKWLYHHFMLVKRIIGVSRDVVSIADNATTQLAGSMLKPLFDPLWKLRCAMTREWNEVHVQPKGHGNT